MSLLKTKIFGKNKNQTVSRKTNTHLCKVSITLCSFLKKYSTRMKTVKRLNIKDKPSYFFMNMTNINDFDPNLLLINELTMFENRSIMSDINYCKVNNTPYVF